MSIIGTAAGVIPTPSATVSGGMHYTYGIVLDEGRKLWIRHNPVESAIQLPGQGALHL
jgi:hypothetical protein